MNADARMLAEVRDLAFKASDGRLTDEEADRFSQLLEQHRDACHEALNCAMLEADLVFHARAQAAEDRVAELIFRERRPEAARRWQKLYRAPALRWLAAASALAAAIAVFFLSQTEVPEVAVKPPVVEVTPILAVRQPEPIATITDADDAKFAGRPLQVGDLVFEGEQVRLLKGEISVGMASGADFVLTAPADVRFISMKHIQLVDGVLAAEVAEWASGFVVETADMRVTDLGTRFAIAASRAGAEAHVLQGQVRVQPLAAKLDGRRSLLLHEGEALRVDRLHHDAERIDAQRDRFPSTDSALPPFKTLSLANTGAGLAEGDEDSHWRITAGPIGAGYHGPQFGVVATADERYAPNEPDRSQWLSVAKDLRPGGLRNSIFTFATTFDLTGFDPQSVTVSAQILADNGVRAIRINGEPVPIEAWDDNQPEQEFSRNRFRMVEIRSGFVAGENRLEFDVWNGIYNIEGMKDDPNPVSLRVEFQAFGRPREEPKASDNVAQTEGVSLKQSRWTEADFDCTRTAACERRDARTDDKS